MDKKLRIEGMSNNLTDFIKLVSDTLISNQQTAIHLPGDHLNLFVS